MSKDNVVDIDQPRCSICGKVKPGSELEGDDPFARPGSRYKNAYCRNLADCDSQKATPTFEKLLEMLDRP